MPDLFTLGPDGGAFGAEMAVGVDLHLDAAIAEDALGNHRHHVDAVDFLRHDEGGGLVVGIGGAGTDGGDEGIAGRDDVALPAGLAAGQERHHLAALAGPLQDK